MPNNPATEQRIEWHLDHAKIADAGASRKSYRKKLKNGKGKHPDNFAQSFPFN